MICTECGAPVDAEPTCRYCGAPRVHARDHGWRDTDKTIDVGELCEWILAKLEKHGKRPTDEEQLRILRGAVVAAIRRDDPEVRIAVTLAGPTGPVEIAEVLTRTAARSLFANISEAIARERAETHAREHPLTSDPAPPREEAVEERETFLDKPSAPYVITAGILLLAVVLAALGALASHHDEERGSHAPKTEGRH